MLDLMLESCYSLNIKYGEYKMVTVDLGNKKRKFKSVKEYAEFHGIKYITAYMRLRMGAKPLTAAKKPVRKYTKH